MLLAIFRTRKRMKRIIAALVLSVGALYMGNAALLATSVTELVGAIADHPIPDGEQLGETPEVLAEPHIN